jgi:hypothetical protein
MFHKQENKKTTITLDKKNKRYRMTRFIFY